MSEISQLVEQIPQDLLDESNKFTIVFVDGATGQELGGIDEVENPWALDLRSLLPNQTFMDIERFFEIASQVIEDAQVRAGVNESERVKLVHEYQPEDFHLFGNEVISYRILSRQPANMNIKGTGRPQLGPGFHLEGAMSTHPNTAIVVESRPIDHEIEFSCWAKTSTLANKRALWLERLFITHAWAFSIQGVNRFIWSKRNADTVWKTGEQRVHQRPLVWFVRLSEFEVKSHPVIQQFNLKLQLSNP